VNEGEKEGMIQLVVGIYEGAKVIKGPAWPYGREVFV